MAPSSRAQMTSLLGTTALRCGLVTVSVSASSNELFLDLRRWSSSIFSNPKVLEKHLRVFHTCRNLHGVTSSSASWLRRADMSFLPWDAGEASLAETLVYQAVSSGTCYPPRGPVLPCAKGAKWARSRSAHFPRIWSSSARWVVGSISHLPRWPPPLPAGPACPPAEAPGLPSHCPASHP